MALGRLLFALSVVAGSLTFPLGNVEASNTAITLAASDAIVAPGSPVSVTAAMPVSDAGTVSQEIVQNINPDKIRLTSIADISYPYGWTLSISTDGNNFTTNLPTTSAGWGAVRSVKATGNVVSLGSDNGFQIASGTGSGSASVVTVGSIAASGLGDGYEAFFDPSRTRVFNLYHHSYDANPSRALLDCHFIATGATCPGFPYSTGYPTGDYVSGRVVGTKLWYTTGVNWSVRNSNQFYGSPGFGCVDLSLVLASNGNPRLCTTPFVAMASTSQSLGEHWQIANEAIPGQSTVGTNSETRLWTFTGSRLVCLDTATSAACAGMPTDGWPIPNAPEQSHHVSLDVINGRIFYAGSVILTGPPTFSVGVVGCVMANNPMQQCPGWLGAKYTTTNNQFFQLMSIPDATGKILAVCGSTNISTPGTSCFDLNGQPYTKPSSLPTLYYGRGITKGSRIYGTGSTSWCWDAAANGGVGGVCYSTDQIGGYTQVPDPILPNCIWVVYDPQPVVRTYDISSGTPVSGCANFAGTLLKFPASAVVPRMACAKSANGVRSWRSFTLLSPSSAAPNTYTSAKLTVKSTFGAEITGWTSIPISVNSAIDLSTLSPTVTGQDPSFEVMFTGVSGTLTTGSARVEVVGDAPELCLTPTAVAPCPVLTGPIRDLSGTSTTVGATGSATDSQSTTTPFAPATVNLTITTPTPEQCGSSLSGIAKVLGTTVPVAGITVTLLDASGNPIVDSSSHPITTTTGSNGIYTFGQLFPASYKVRFDDLGSKTVASTTVTAGGSGSTTDNTAATSLISAVSTLTVDTDGVVDAEYRAPAAAANDVSTGAQSTNQTISVLANDNSTSGATLTASSIRLCSSGQTPPNCTLMPGNVNGVVVAGEGRYTVNSSGVVTFSPCTGPGSPVGACNGVFTGTATPISYQVTDSTSAVVSATITPTVTPAPTPSPDSQSGPYDSLQVYVPYANDIAGAGTTLDSSPVGICVSSTTTVTACNGQLLAVSGEGTYVLNKVTGTVTFDPLPTFIGTATPIKYVVVDKLGQKVLSTITPTVLAPPPPSGVADTSIGTQGASQTVNPFSNDVPGASGMTFTASSVKLCSTGQTSPNCTATSLTVNGQGTYTVNAATGVITFQPCVSIVAVTCASGAFTGVASPVNYQVGTNTLQTATSTYTPTVVPPPTAVADAQSGAWDTNQTYTPHANDSAGTGTTLAVSPSGICLNSVASASSCSATTITIANQGTYTLNLTTGVVTFDPLVTFSGTATAIKYAATDALGQKVLSTITPTVLSPPAPTANADTSAGIVGASQIVTPFANDTTAGAAITFTATSVKLCSTGQSSPNCTATSLVVSGQGSYSVNGTTGAITFTPCSGANTPVMNPACANSFTGVATPVTYQVGTNFNQTATSTYTPTVVPPPTAVADTQTGLWDSNVVFTPTSNDSAGSGASLVAVPYGICLNSVSVPSSCSTIGNSIVIPNQGTYSLNTNTGSVTFDPLPSFTGNATAIKYAVSDSLGQKTLATITPSITPPLPPSATSESKSVIPGGSVSFTTLTGANGLASTSGPTFSTSASCLVNTSVIPNTCGTTLTIAGEGVYSLNTGTGVVTFSADIGISTGTQTPISYRVTDATGQTATSTLTPIVPPRPTANNDYVVGEQNETQVLSPLSNDEAASSTSLDSSSMRLCPDNASAPFTNTNCNLISLDVADVGRFIVNNDGTVSFTPCVIVAGVVCAGSYNGSTTFAGIAEVRYAIADQVGQFNSAMIRAEVLPPPVVRPVNDALTRNFGQSAVFDPLANDSGGTTTGLAGYSATGSADVATSTLKLCGASQTAPHCTATYVVRDEGTYTLNSMTNRITFDPANNFVGTPSIAPLYMVCNQIGGSWAPLTPSSTCSTANITPTILPPSSPSASNDLENGPYNTPLIINVLANDTKDAALSIANSTVKLCTSIQTPPNCSAVSLSSPGEGVYTVDSNTGRVTFTPEASFAGTPSLRPTYQFTDSYGASASAIITPTIAAPEVPIANAQAKVVLPGSAVEFTNVIGVSALGSGTGLRSGAIDGPCLVDPSDGQCKSTFAVTGEGTWSIDQTTGIPTFTADPDVASGVQTAVLYRITDVVGQIASAYLTPNVPPNASMTADSGSAGVDINQTFSVLANDTPGNGTTFDSASLRLCDVGESLPTCTALTVTINGEGTYTIGSNGVVTFNPDPDFAGVAGVISYQVTDSVGRVTSSTVRPTVTAVPPSAAPDTILLAPGQISSFRSIFASGGLVSLNAGGVALDVSSVCIEDPVSLQCATTPIAVAGEGIFSIDTNTGIVSFAAESGALAGPQTVITYRITDRAGNVVQSTLTPIIVAPPILSPDASSGVQGAPQVIRPLVNDRPGNNNVPLVPSSLRLCAQNEVAPACTRTTLVIDGEGTYVVNTATGDITFTPLASFSGSATSISYVLDDSLGQRQTSTIALVVTAQDNSGDAGSGSQETDNAGQGQGQGQGQDTTSQTDDHPLPTTGTNIVDVLPWALALIIFGRRVKRIRLY